MGASTTGGRVSKLSRKDAHTHGLFQRPFGGTEDSPSSRLSIGISYWTSVKQKVYGYILTMAHTHGPMYNQ